MKSGSYVVLIGIDATQETVLYRNCGLTSICRFMAASKVLGEETVAGAVGKQQPQQGQKGSGSGV